MVLSNDELLKACFNCQNDFNRFMERPNSKPVLKAMDLLRLQMKKEYDKQNRANDK